MQDGLIERSGDRFSILDGKSMHGIPRVIAKIESDDELREELESLIQARTEVLAEGDDGA